MQNIHCLLYTSRSDLTLLDVLKAKKFRTEVGPGVYDIHSPRIPTVEAVSYTHLDVYKRQANFAVHTFIPIQDLGKAQQTQFTPLRI